MGYRGTEEAANLLDLENRDPHELNPRVKILFEDVIGEPDGAHSAPRIFRTTYRSYYLGRNCCFTLLSYVCTVPLSFLWGCSFAAMSFCQIWCCTPGLHLFNLTFTCVAHLYSTITHCLQDPCYEAAALLFSKIYVTHIKSEQGYASKKAADLNEMNELKTYENV